MNHEKKEAEEQLYSPKAKPELINTPEEPETKSESTNDDPRHGEERSSALQPGSSEQARRLVVNYARSLLLF